MLQSTASESTLVALLAARTKALKHMRRESPAGATDSELLGKMTLYTSDQVGCYGRRWWLGSLILRSTATAQRRLVFVSARQLELKLTSTLLVSVLASRSLTALQSSRQNLARTTHHHRHHHRETRVSPTRTTQTPANTRTIRTTRGTKQHEEDTQPQEHTQRNEQQHNPNQPPTSPRNQAHSSVQKAANVAGLGSNMRLIPARGWTGEGKGDDREGQPEHNTQQDRQAYAIDAAELYKAMRRDVKAGLTPIFVCANVGSTNTCAVDHVGELGDACRRCVSVCFCRCTYAVLDIPFLLGFGLRIDIAAASKASWCVVLFPSFFMCLSHNAGDGESG